MGIRIGLCRPQAGYVTTHTPDTSPGGAPAPADAGRQSIARQSCFGWVFGQSVNAVHARHVTTLSHFLSLSHVSTLILPLYDLEESPCGNSIPGSGRMGIQIG